MTFLIIVSLLLLIVGSCGVYLITRYTLSYLRQGSELRELESRRRELRNDIRRNEMLLTSVYKIKDESGIIRLTAIIEAQKLEYDAVNRRIIQLKVDKAEQKAIGE